MAFTAQIVLSNLGLVALAAIVLLGYLAVYLLSRRHLERTIEKLRNEWTEEINSLIVKARLEQRDAAVSVPPPVVQPVAVAQAVPVPVIAPSRKEEVTPETLLVIAAAVTAYLGKKVRVRSAKMLYSHESFNAWSQQGRAVVQASHNVAQRVH
jgi:hypothetical protein